MIEVESAEELVLCNSLKLQQEMLPLKSLAVRVLAESISAKRHQPPFDRVAMDGIAICFQGSSQKNFKIEGIQRAGQAALSLIDPNNALEVMTGAMLPVGTNTVIPYEVISIKNNIAFLNDDYQLEEKKNIHFHSSDYQQGEILLTPGTKLTSAGVALIAGQGSKEALVSKSPQIAIISTGDELIEPGNVCEKWQIWRSNPYGIQAELLGLGISKNEIDFFHLKDNPEEMINTLSKVLETHQVLILSGGVSMGKYDFVHSIMNDLGVKKIFHKIKQKPGKPMFFGVGTKGQNVFGLPGNPVSALVCMRRYVIPGLSKALGFELVKQYAILEEDVFFKKEFTLFCPVTIACNQNGQQSAMPISTNGSGDFSGLAKSDGFLQLPSNKKNYIKGEAYPLFKWHRN